MSMPLSQDYNEAIQSPSSFSDPELKQGEVATNVLGLPMPRSGNFADVYELRTSRGRWAIKCFTRAIPGLQERYKEISAYLRQTPLPFMVDFSFIEKGIRVRNDWHPILKMEWVEGLTLNEFIKTLLDKPNRLNILAQLWIRLSIRLHQANMAHCDLQHGNVLLVPGSKAASLAVKLVDYDGMCVPALTLLKSIEVGHPNFQHPQRLRENIYSVDVDRFSHLVIYTALRALTVGGRALWEAFDNSDNLLFKSADFDAPTKSLLFAELLQSSDPAVPILAETMLRALERPLSQTPLLEEVASALPVPSVAGATAISTAEDLFASATADPPPLRPRPKKSNGRLIATAVVSLLILVGSLLSYFTMQPGDNKDKPVAVPDSGKAAKEPATKIVQKPPEPPKEIVNSIKMRFHLIPAGEFTMGSPDNEASREAREGPRHWVKISKPFYMGTYEVKQSEYEMVMGKHNFSFKDPDNPAENIIWDEAMAFCKRLSDLPEEKKAGRVYRLPTEAEWEYACRAAGTTTAFHYGNTLSSKQANFNGGAPYGGGEPGLNLGKTANCGSYQPNAWGLFDMHGNVWEWCLDGPRDYPKEPLKEPVVDPKGPETAGGFRVLRGGSWLDEGFYCRSARRHPHFPANRNPNVGLRMVLLR